MVSILHFFHDRLPFHPGRTTDLEFQRRKVHIDQRCLLTPHAMVSVSFLHRDTQACSQFELVCHPVGGLRVTKRFRLKP